MRTVSADCFKIITLTHNLHPFPLSFVFIADLHVWAMSTSETALTVHLVISDGHPEDDFLNRVAGKLHHDFAIEHATIQIETGNQNCALSNHA
jgi:hypothetical protein